MTNTEWQVGTTQTGVPASSSGTGPDLFSGDLFGDELIEMYNSDAVVGTTGEIPTLLPPETSVSTFGPSSSFTELNALLSPETPSPDPVGSNTTAAQRKRSSQDAGLPAASPKTKKRNSTKQQQQAAAVAATAAVAAAAAAAAIVAEPPSLVPSNIVTAAQSAGEAALKLRKEQQALFSNNNNNNNNNNANNTSDAATTPNPLMLKNAKKKTVMVPLTAPAPAVVSPRVAGANSNAGCSKADSITSEAAAATAAAAAVAAATAQPVAVTTSTIAQATTATTTNAAPTEADFKGVAQAAVTNLILNAGTAKNEAAKNDPNRKNVDTSTAHVKALTSSNWVAACLGANTNTTTTTTATATATSCVTADSKANRARRQNLTPDERARQNRDRNREHARNTRLRKKAYVEELKRTLTELVSQRDTAELEKRHAAQRDLEQREVRFRVMEEFLKLRGRNELHVARWVAILEDEFSMGLPRTEYRKMVLPSTTATSGRQHLVGAQDAMMDSAHMSEFLQTLGNDNSHELRHHQQLPQVTLQYCCDRKNFFMDGCTGILLWTATSVGAVGQGAPEEMMLEGNMRAKFSPASNKLLSVELLFDTGSVVAQLQRLDTSKDDEEEEEERDAVAAAVAAASEADVLLDSLQMPPIASAVPTAITLVPAVSVTSSDKDDSSDESLSDSRIKETLGMNSRRSSRLKD